jgi:hypothetical protein
MQCEYKDNRVQLCTINMRYFYIASISFETSARPDHSPINVCPQTNISLASVLSIIANEILDFSAMSEPPKGTKKCYQLLCLSFHVLLYGQLDILVSLFDGLQLCVK